ncbi:LysE family translocator [Paenalcaligenes suwonensis]|uniref:LysE family translocator n=1 Tax=Paenalcaligenes suwonensis TaxID=1202713 RepID=UPI00140BB73D|nr:LysE family translocator [Paenalcaligenes suwonensis]NHC60682.1 LysE family translocator [Paenalcaligenes suwonensis]
MSMEFVLTSLLIVVSPGIGVIYTIAAGLSGGLRASVVAAIGCTLGIVPHAVVAISGLTMVLHASAMAFQLLKYLGVVYLIYMALSMLRESGPLRFEADQTKANHKEIIVSAVLINLLNPKLSVFFFAFLPQFIRSDDVLPVSQMLWLSGVFMLMSLVVFVLYGACAVSVRRYIISNVRVQLWMRRLFGAAFLGLSVQLALSKQ